MDIGAVISAAASRLAEWWREFCEWQRTPMRNPPLSEQQAVCLNCGDSYDGDFCPRCGQPATAQRFTVGHVMRQALDVWGLGGRKSMPRTIWHLIWRPGYMIYDYLKGHRQPYFSPFKMLFLVTAALAVFVHMQPGAETQVDAQNHMLDSLERVVTDFAESYGKEQNRSVKEYQQSTRRIMQPVRSVVHWFDTHDVAIAILFHLSMTLFVMWMFRKTPRLGCATAVEHFYAQVFIASQLSIFKALGVLLMVVFSRHATASLPSEFTYALFVLDFKQLYGFGWWKTAWKTLLVFILYGIVMIVLILLSVLCMMFGSVALISPA